MLEGRKIVLGVSGGIAAYKAVEICRRLTDAGAQVVPVLTDGALRFVGETTFSALSGQKARTSLFDDADPIPHTSLGQTADLILVCPATARVIGSYAAGISDDLLTATLLATRAPVVVCPAMHTEMWEHPAVQENIAKLVSRGVNVVAPEAGRLAGGDVGAGRLAGPDRILAAVEAALSDQDMAGLTVLVTAGGTREPIDPVRFIGNRSSGRQGHAVAAEAAARGAAVTLVTTSAATAPSHQAIEIVAVDTAAQMEEVVLGRPAPDVVVMAAAVADFRPVARASNKIKKTTGLGSVELEPTTDILAELGARRTAGQILVGFAAETEDLVAHARSKLDAKGVDVIVANDVSAEDAGFEVETNRVVIVTSSGEEVVPLADKRQIAGRILDAVLAMHSSG